MKDLTRRQQEVLDVIVGTIREKGYPPSMREITTRLQLASAAGVHKHIKALVRKGYLSKEDYLSRSLRVVPRGETSEADTPYDDGAAVELPLAGYVAAGQPIDAIEQQGETLSVPAAMLSGGRGPHFALRVRGDSMVEDSILDGDYVIVESRATARSGEVVVALLHGGEATLKRYVPDGSRVRLQPANASMAPIVVPADQVDVQGVVVGIWRRFPPPPVRGGGR